jgi:hypothetical protein
MVLCWDDIGQLVKKMRHSELVKKRKRKILKRIKIGRFVVVRFHLRR